MEKKIKYTKGSKIKKKTTIKRIKVKIKIKNKLEGKNKFFIRRLNWKEKNSKKIKKIRTK